MSSDIFFNNQDNNKNIDLIKRKFSAHPPKYINDAHNNFMRNNGSKNFDMKR